jgi:predicted outer membrane repeat protein
VLRYAFFLLPLLTASPTGSAANTVVCGANASGCSDCGAIGLTLAILSASAGDTIEVCGDFFGGNGLDKNLTIEGVGSGATFNVSNDNSFYIGLYSTNASVTIRNLEFTGHSYSAVINDDATLTVESCTFENNSNYDGPALQSFGGVLNVSDSSFSQNSATLGGAIAMESAEATISTSTFVLNDAHYGGAIYAEDSVVTLTANTFDINDSSLAGGAVYAEFSDLHLEANVFTENTSDFYGGALALDGTPTVLIGNRFVSNVASDAGGGMLVGGSSTVTNYRNLWCENTSDFGGATYLLPNVNLTAKNDIYMLNEALTSGGAYSLDTVDATLVNNHFIGNEALADGSGSVYANEATRFEFVNNLVTDGTTSLIVSASTGLSYSNVDYNHWFESDTSLDASITVGANNGQSGEPVLVNPYPYANADLPDCTIDGFDLTQLRPQPSSPLIDAGSTNICDPTSNMMGCILPATGSLRSDIGAFGGKKADLEWHEDADGDGLIYMLDCDDTDDTVGGTTTWYADQDGDDFGDGSSSIETCEQPTGFVADATDCDDSDPAVTDPQFWYDDVDGDGYGDPSTQVEFCQPPSGASVSNGDDCDDNNSSILSETTWYLDNDGDSYGDPNTSVEACDQPVGYVRNNLDCDDTNPTTVQLFSQWYSDEDEDSYGDPNTMVWDCNQPVGYVSNDMDCDDTDSSITTPNTWYLDDDGDDYGDSSEAVESCTQPTPYVLDDTDCDDTDPSVWTEQAWYTDSDGDGYGADNPVTTSCQPPSGDSVTLNGDCDDTDPAINPETTWHKDKDGDGYGDPSKTSQACQQPPGFVDNDQDCDDDDASIHPNTTWFLDNDQDGYGDPAISQVQCEALTSYVTNHLDCNDADPDQYPGVSWYADADGDEYGDPSSVTDCAPADPTDVLDNTDCDDTDPALNPTTIWYPDCDGDGYHVLEPVTQCEEPAGPCDDGEDPLGDWTTTPPSAPDCDDEDPEQNPSTRWYLDSDQDGFGASGTVLHIGCLTSYTGTENVAPNDTDCDDVDEEIFPGADEYCNGEDNDCDGQNDNDALDAIAWQADCDGDSYLGATEVFACTPTDSICDDGDDPDGGWLESGSTAEDCDDEDPTINPETIWWPDRDGDGAGGEDGDVIIQCEPPGDGYAANDLDCDDEDPLINGYADELCNGIDDNCDDLIDDQSATDAPDWYPDCDGDGYYAERAIPSCVQPPNHCLSSEGPLGGWADTLEDEADCDDEDPEQYPSQSWYIDEDNDGYGRFGEEGALVQCLEPDGYVPNNADCDDKNDQVNPLASEIPSDGVDNNCDEYAAKTWLGGSGCGCTSTPSPIGWWALLLPMLWWTRRSPLQQT